MPFSTVKELPESVRNTLPQHAQEIFKEAFNSASDEYKDPAKRRRKSDDPEEIAFRVAWSAVKESYEKVGDQWVAKKNNSN